MSTWTLIAGGVVLGLVWGVAGVVWSCDCGRQRRWYFRRFHEQGPVMLFPIAVELAYLVGALLVLGWRIEFVPAFLGCLPSWAYWLRRWWLHEHDRIRRAARALGRVRVNEHGRLVVS